jgi:hypothetical protein
VIILVASDLVRVKLNWVLGCERNGVLIVHMVDGRMLFPTQFNRPEFSRALIFSIIILFSNKGSPFSMITADYIKETSDLKYF